MRRRGNFLDPNSSQNQIKGEQHFPSELRLSSLLLSRLKSENLPQIVVPYDLPVDERVKSLQKGYFEAFQENKELNLKLTEVIEDRNNLAERYNAIKRAKSTEDAVKRKRRYARDIQRLFYCPIDKCHRGYGSEGSLSHHVRLKHLEFYESGKYEIFIQNYIDQLSQKEKQHKDQEPQSQTPLKKVKKEELEKKPSKAQSGAKQQGK